MPFTPDPMFADLVKAQTKKVADAEKNARDTRLAHRDLKAQRATLSADRTTDPVKLDEQLQTIERVIRISEGRVTIAEREADRAVSVAERAEKAAAMSTEGQKRRTDLIIDDPTDRLNELAAIIRTALKEISDRYTSIRFSLQAELESRGHLVVLPLLMGDSQSIEMVLDSYLRNPALEFVYANKITGIAPFVEIDLPPRDQLSARLIHGIESKLNGKVIARWRGTTSNDPSAAPKNAGF